MSRARANQSELLKGAFTLLLRDPSFVEYYDEDAGPEGFITESPRTAFLSWSTGHKIAMHVIVSLVANATRKALILFDEPEMHLHPPLASALMHAVRHVLDGVDAFCIVATHSPVVPPETLTRHVRIISRLGEAIDSRKPKLETFGENMGVIAYDIFGMTCLRD